MDATALNTCNPGSSNHFQLFPVVPTKLSELSLVDFYSPGLGHTITLEPSTVFRVCHTLCSVNMATGAMGWREVLSEKEGLEMDRCPKTYLP